MAVATRLCVIVLVVATLAAFGPTLRNDFVAWDDDHNLIRNTKYQGLDGEHLRWMFTTSFAGHYQPLTWLSFAVESQLLWGVNPAGFHFTNLLLHLATSIGFFFVARSLIAASLGNDPPQSPLTKGGRHGVVVLGAFIATLWWAVHPLRVESVAWATERRDVLSGVWLVLAVFAYLRYAARSPRHRLWLGLSLGCFVLSLLSKAVGMTLPVVLIILDIYPLRRCQSRDRKGAVLERVGTRSSTPVASAPCSETPWTIAIEKLLFAVPAGLAAATALWAQWDVGAIRTLDEHSLGLRIAQAFYGIVFYLGKMLWPVNLVPLYEQSPTVTPWEPTYVASAIVCVAMTITLWLLRRRWPALITAWAAYIVLLSPMLGLAQSGPQLVADRYTYLPSQPLAILIGAGCALLSRRLVTATPIGRVAVALPLVAVVSCLFLLTRVQTRVWTDTYTLWRTTVERRPDTPTAHANLAVALNQRGEFEGARNHALLALSRLPGNRAAHAALARAALELGDLGVAERHSRIALQIAEHVGRIDAPTMVGLAIVATRLGRMDEAEAIYHRIVELEPAVAEWCFNLASFLASQSRYRESIPWFEHTVRLDPSHGEAYYRLGMVWMKLSDPARASAVWQHGLAQGNGLSAELQTRFEAALREFSPPPDW